jgi:hypothetical protein
MDGYVTRRSGTVGHEVLSPDGEIIAWTTDGYWAATIAALLDRIETGGLVRQGTSEPAVHEAETRPTPTAMTEASLASIERDEAEE